MSRKAHLDEYVGRTLTHCGIKYEFRYAENRGRYIAERIDSRGCYYVHVDGSEVWDFVNSSYWKFDEVGFWEGDLQ